jgi:hypothetical protein
MGLTENDIRRVIWTFVQTFLGAFYLTANWMVGATELQHGEGRCDLGSPGRDSPPRSRW